MRSPFRPLSEEDQKKREAQKKEIADQINEFAEIGRSLLEHEDFALYRQRFMELRERMIKSLIQDAEPDPIKFAFKAKTILAKIDGLSMLIEAPQVDIDKLKTLKG